MHALSAYIAWYLTSIDKKKQEKDIAVWRVHAKADQFVFLQV